MMHNNILVPAGQHSGRQNIKKNKQVPEGRKTVRLHIKIFTMDHEKYMRRYN